MDINNNTHYITINNLYYFIFSNLGSPYLLISNFIDGMFVLDTEIKIKEPKIPEFTIINKAKNNNTCMINKIKIHFKVNDDYSYKYCYLDPNYKISTINNKIIINYKNEKIWILSQINMKNDNKNKNNLLFTCSAKILLCSSCKKKAYFCRC
jgi:hypothetical protein